MFVNRRDQREIFDQAFHVYWRNPRLLEKMMEMLLPSVGVPADPDDKKQLSRRLQEALHPGRGEAPKAGRTSRPRAAATSEAVPLVADELPHLLTGSRRLPFRPSPRALARVSSTGRRRMSSVATARGVTQAFDLPLCWRRARVPADPTLPPPPPPSP